MGNQLQSLFENIKLLLPRKNSDAKGHPSEVPPAPVTEQESRVIQQTAVTERQRWRAIVESGIPVSMIVIGGLLSGFAELIGIWSLLGFLLLAAAPVVWCVQQVEKRITEMTEEIKKLRQQRR